MSIMQTISNAIDVVLPERAAIKQTLGHPASGIIGWATGAENTSGVVVTEDTALTFAAVWAATRILSETVASLPLLLYERTAAGKQRATDNPLFQLVGDEPNAEMSSYSWIETSMGHVVNYGNAYSEIIRGPGGRPIELWPLPPNQVTAGRDENGELAYVVRRSGGKPEPLPAENILHIPGLGFDGITGYSVIRYAAQSVGLGIAAEQYGGSLFGSGGRPSGVLQHPGRLSPEAREHLRREWEDMHGRADKANRVGVLWEGMQYTPISIPPEEAQFLQTRKFQVIDVARWYRLPPHMLGDLDRATFNNIEQQNISFVQQSLLPWLRRWEAGLKRRLLTEADKRRLFWEFLVDGLLRGDIKTRYEAYAIGRQWGWLSVDDIRRKENENDLPGDQGKIYLQPMNMVPAGEFEDDDRDEAKAFADSMAESLANIQTTAAAIRDGLQVSTGDVERLTRSHSAQAEKLHNARRDIVRQLDRLETLVQVRPQFAPEPSANGKHEEHSEDPPDFEPVRLAALDMLADASQRMLKIEATQVAKAAKRQLESGDNFCRWLDDWYLWHADRVRDAFRAPCSGLSPFVSTDMVDTLERLIEEHIRLSREALLAAAGGERDAFAERVKETVDTWAADRAAELERVIQWQAA
jgi:HK97 family phage portal protein